MFAALAVPTRRTIIEMLARRGRLSATDICSKFNMSPPAISQHLKILRDVDLVTVEKRGQQRIYQINVEKVYEFERWAHHTTHLWNMRLDSLEDALRAEKKKFLKNSKKKR